MPLSLIRNTKVTIARLYGNQLQAKEILADAGFSSGENYAQLEDMNLIPYIPPHGQYKSHRKDFKYEARCNAFICPKGQILKAAYTKSDHGRKQIAYISNTAVCDGSTSEEEMVQPKSCSYPQQLSILKRDQKNYS